MLLWRFGFTDADSCQYRSKPSETITSIIQICAFCRFSCLESNQLVLYSLLRQVLRNCPACTSASCYADCWFTKVVNPDGARISREELNGAMEVRNRKGQSE